MPVMNAVAWTELDTAYRPPQPEEKTERQLAAEAARAAAIEAQRLRRRQEIRVELAGCDLAQQRCDELATALAEIDARKDAAAAEHVADCAALQAELAEIERRQTAALRNRQPLDAAAEARRRELLESLKLHNATLEETIAHQDRLAAPLREEMAGEAKKLVKQNALEAELFATGPITLRAQHKAVAETLRYLQMRQDRQIDPRSPHPAKNPNTWERAELAEIERCRAEALRVQAEICRRIRAED